MATPSNEAIREPQSDIVKNDCDGTPPKVHNQNKSSSPIASPDSSVGRRRGRSRTRGTPSKTAGVLEQDRRGYHSLMSSFGKVFHVEKRWKLIREMGSGAYGYVISAADELSGEPVAIKMITRVFDKVQLAKRALREITLLRHFSHENITGLIDVDCSENNDEIYIFMEPMEADLHQIIKSGQSLSNDHAQYFVYQILRGLKYVHSASVVHRDLKPGNLLVNADCGLKICDFGLSRGFNSAPDNPTIMTEYVATRWYRAPEIMLAFRGYNTAIDIWSVGCILAELLLGKPLFKGKDYVDQLNKILELLGTPEDAVIDKIGSEKAQAYVRSLPYKPTVPFSKLLPNADPQALDLLEQLLAFDPSARPTASGALEHPWLSTYHDPEDEPICEQVFNRWKVIEDLETLDEFRQALLWEVESCRQEVRFMGGFGRSPSSGHEDILKEVEELEELEEDKLMPMSPPLGIRQRSPAVEMRAESPQANRQDSRDSEGLTQAQPTTDGTSTGATARIRKDPVVAYAQRSSMFLPSRTNSAYSVHRVPAPDSLTDEDQSSTIAFPTAGEPPGHTRRRTASTFGYPGAWPSEPRRRLLRTLSTVSIYETGEGHAGGLADIAPIGKYIVEKNRTGDDGVASEMPRELGGDDAEHRIPGTPSTMEKRDGDSEKKRRFLID